jgi:hypothetical protein
VIDLGSGDGRIVVTAARQYGARGFGVDLNPERIKESNENARKAGVTDKVAFYQRNLFETDLSQATVITMYLLPRVNMELRPKLLQLKPGTRLVSHDFSMEDWKPDTQVTLETPENGAERAARAISSTGSYRRRSRHLAVGADGGRQAQPYEVTLDQKFQVVSGAARVGGRTVKLQDVRLNGDELRFAFTADVNGAPVKQEFSGKVEGDSINGSSMMSGARVQGSRNGTRAKPAPPAHHCLGSAGASLPSGSAGAALPSALPACPVDAGPGRHGARGRLPRGAGVRASRRRRGSRAGKGSGHAVRPDAANRRRQDAGDRENPADDYVIDLGSGDGRMVITAASATARAASGWTSTAGWSIWPTVTRQGRRGEARGVLRRDLFQTDVSPASVLTLYLTARREPRDTLPAPGDVEARDAHRVPRLRVRRMDARLAAGDARAGKTVGIAQKSKVFHWVVPGVAAGKWRWQLQRDGRSEDHELSLDQNFQKLQGTLSVGGRPMKVEKFSLVGEQLSFAVVVNGGAGPVRYDFSGRIFNNALTGTVRVSRGEKPSGQPQELAWNATRTQIWDPLHVVQASQPPK